MSLINNLLPKKETGDYYLIVGLDGSKVIAATTQILDNRVRILGTGEQKILPGKKESEAFDEAVTEAEKGLPENTLVEKTVFAVPQFFLQDDNIKPEHLKHLKKITDEFNLKPQGFIDYPSSLLTAIESEEGSPPTLLLLELSKDYFSCLLVRVGKIQQSETVKRSESVAADFEKILPQLSSEVLPSRIIIYGHAQSLEKMKEELMKISWHKHSSFLHTPKIESFSSRFILEAIVEAASSSMLKTFSTASDDLLDINQNTLPETKTENQVFSSDENDTDGLFPPSKNERTEESVIPEKEPEITEENQDQDENQEITPDDTFGFVKTSTEAAGSKQKENENITEISKVAKEKIKSELFPQSGIQKSAKKAPSLRLPALPKLNIGAALIRLPLFFISLLPVLTLAFYLFWLYPKASLYLIIYPLMSTQRGEITFTTNSAAQSTGDKIFVTANTVSLEETGEKTAAVTGKTSVGEKAKGEVTIYNKTLNSKTFPRNAVLKSENLEFSLDDSVTVASASDTGEGLSYGKSNIKITSLRIGPENNLTSNSSFIFKDQPETSFIAKNQQALTGGSSREVASVSKEDREKLEEELIEELEIKIKENITQKLTANEKLLDSSAEKKVTAKKFSAEVGEETEKLSLSLTLKVNLLAYKQEELTALAREIITSPPAGFTLEDKKLSIIPEEIIPDKDGNYAVKALISAYFLPEIDLTSMQKSVVGKTYQEAVQTVSKYEKVAGLRIVQDTSLPILKTRLPFNPQNISLNILTY